MFAIKMKGLPAFILTVAAGAFSANAAIAAGQEVVNFRLPEWKSAHFDDAKSAQANFQTLKQLGCEAEQHQHGGHFDVRYRCPQWHSISLTSHNEAHQWQRWLDAFGFETAHQH